jgi:hypothetical protein
MIQTERQNYKRGKFYFLLQIKGAIVKIIRIKWLTKKVR